MHTVSGRVNSIMIYLKLLVPIVVLVIGFIHVALQEKWRKIHDGRTNRHKRVIRSLVLLMCLGTVGTCGIVWWDAVESSRQASQIDELLREIDNCQPPKRMGALKPRYLTPMDKGRAGVTMSKNSIHVAGTRKADQQAMQFSLAEDEILQPLGPNVAFAIRKTQEGLLVSAIVRSVDGKVAARIVDNVWIVYDKRYLLRNFDSSAVEVIDDYDVPVFQIEYLFLDTIKVGGVFRAEKESVSQTDPQFPSRRAGSGGTYLCYVKGGGMVVLGSQGMTLGGKWPTTPGERDDLVTKAKKIISPWFDYSNPDKVGVRTLGPKNRPANKANTADTKSRAAD